LGWLNILARSYPINLILGKSLWRRGGRSRQWIIFTVKGLLHMKVMECFLSNTWV